MGIKWAITKGWKHCVFEMDSLNLFMNLKSVNSSFWEISTVVCACLTWCNQFDSYVFSLVKRTGNKPTY